MKRRKSEVSTMFGELSEFGIDIDSSQTRLLESFAEILCSYDRANVIGVRDFEEVVKEHILDSLSCMQAVGFDEGDSVADMGSGAGLPGIPLAIVNPGTNFVLMDSVGKKISFQNHAVSRLGLANVESVQGRLEEIGRDKEHRSSYGVVTSRALASLSAISEYGLPLLKVGGSLVCMKGRVEEAELRNGRAAIRELGGEVREVVGVKRLESQGEKERHLVIIEKIRKTPGKYPRETGIPAKQPLVDEGS